MKFSAHGFSIELQPCRTVDDEDWVRVRVLAATPGFRADFEAWLQLDDLCRFGRELEIMYASVGQSLSALLASAEPGIYVRLAMQPLGAMLGTYALESDRAEGTPTVLSGAFQIDQSFLPSLQASVETLVHELRQG